MVLALFRIWEAVLLLNEEKQTSTVIESKAGIQQPKPAAAAVKAPSAKSVTLDIEHLYTTYMSRAWKGAMTRADFDSSLAYLLNIDRRNAHELALCDALFEMFDTNRNGMIEWHEFFVGIAMLCRAPLIKILEVAFRMFDLDGNGLISRDELRAMLARLLPRHVVIGGRLEEVVQEIVREGSWNMDGQISWHEFSQTLGGYKLSKLVTPWIQEQIHHMQNLITEHDQA